MNKVFRDDGKQVPNPQISCFQTQCVENRKLQLYFNRLEIDWSEWITAKSPGVPPYHHTCSSLKLVRQISILDLQAYTEAVE